MILFHKAEIQFAKLESITARTDMGILIFYKHAQYPQLHANLTQAR